MYRCFASRGVWNDFLKFQVVENTFVQLPFSWSALPELLIVVVEASPVLAEFLQTMLVDIFNYTPRASCDPSPFFQALNLALAGTLALALHKIVIIWFASCADEETSR